METVGPDLCWAVAARRFMLWWAAAQRPGLWPHALPATMGGTEERVALMR